jgi:magnesium transporter
MPLTVHGCQPTREAITEALEQNALVWVDIDSTDPHQHELLKSVFHFHPLAIEDTEHPKSRVKVDTYDGYLFITVRVIRFCEETPEDPYDIETVNLYLFIGANYVVTVHAGLSLPVAQVSEVVTRNPDILERGAAGLAHMILDYAIDAYFPILDQIDDFVDSVEDRVFTRFDQSVIQDIFRVKRLVLLLRRYLAPQREVLSALTNRPSPLLPPDVQLYFRDVYDHMLRINDSLDAARDLLSGTMDGYLSQISNRLGRVTKGLSVVATLSIPFVVVSGMWGMNFEKIPLSHYPGGFAIMLGVQILLGLVLLAILRWSRLL